MYIYNFIYVCVWCVCVFKMYNTHIIMCACMFWNRRRSLRILCNYVCVYMSMEMPGVRRVAYPLKVWVPSLVFLVGPLDPWPWEMVGQL